jgi:hypothetical protein
MSWLVETLLRDRYRIRSDPDFASDEYNNLLIIEHKIKELYESGAIDDFELALLEYVSTSNNYTALEEVLGIRRRTIASHFKRICDRVSYALGGEFTDAGYTEYMRTGYNLSEEDIEKITMHMNGNYRHVVRSTPYGKKD